MATVLHTVGRRGLGPGFAHTRQRVESQRNPVCPAHTREETRWHNALPSETGTA